MKRPSFDELYLSIAWLMSVRSVHPKLKVGCVITTADKLEILSTGYNGLESGGSNKVDSIEPGCSGTIHAECGAAVACKAPRSQPKRVYITHNPCVVCARLLINLGSVVEVCYIENYRDNKGITILRRNGIKTKQWKNYLTYVQKSKKF